MTESKRAKFWEDEAKKSGATEEYYRKELAKAHEVRGRVIHQLSERWDSVNLTEYYPTDNLHGLRNINNPEGKTEQGRKKEASDGKTKT